jgi:hypothetical protein
VIKMSKRLIGSLALTVAWLTVTAYVQPAAPFSQRVAWFASMSHDQRDALIDDVRTQHDTQVEPSRTPSTERKQAVVGVRTQQERDRYRAWAWQDWRKDRGRASHNEQ